MSEIKHEKTDLAHLGVISVWLDDGNELPSSGDAGCVLDAVEEIERLRGLVRRIGVKLEYGDIFQWDDGDSCWDEMRRVADIY